MRRSVANGWSPAQSALPRHSAAKRRDVAPRSVRAVSVVQGIRRRTASSFRSDDRADSPGRPRNRSARRARRLPPYPQTCQGATGTRIHAARRRGPHGRTAIMMMPPAPVASPRSLPRCRPQIHRYRMAARRRASTRVAGPRGPDGIRPLSRSAPLPPGSAGRKLIASNCRSQSAPPTTTTAP